MTPGQKYRWCCSIIWVWNALLDLRTLPKESKKSLPGPPGPEGPESPNRKSRMSQKWPFFLGSQHPSPDVKNPREFRAEFWLEIITSRDAKSACSRGSKASCLWQFLALFLGIFCRRTSHHVMEASCWFLTRFWLFDNLFGLLGHSGPGGSGRLFFDAFGISGQKDQKSLCSSRRSQSQTMIHLTPQHLFGRVDHGPRTYYKLPSWPKLLQNNSFGHFTL